jgi:hypothetical protein
MNVEGYYPQGKRWWVRLHEKGGKQHEMPAHHLLRSPAPFPAAAFAHQRPSMELCRLPVPVGPANVRDVRRPVPVSTTRVAGPLHPVVKPGFDFRGLGRVEVRPHGAKVFGHLVELPEQFLAGLGIDIASAIAPPQLGRRRGAPSGIMIDRDAFSIARTGRRLSRTMARAASRSAICRSCSSCRRITSDSSASLISNAALAIGFATIRGCKNGNKQTARLSR